MKCKTCGIEVPKLTQDNNCPRCAILEWGDGGTTNFFDSRFNARGDVCEICGKETNMVTRDKEGNYHPTCGTDQHPLEPKLAPWIRGNHRISIK